MMDRAASTRWGRSLAGAARRLLIGREPSDTLLGSVSVLLPPAWRRISTATGVSLVVLLGAAAWDGLDSGASVYRLLPVGLLATGMAVPVAVAPRRPLLAWRVSLLTAVLTAVATPLQVPGGLPWPPAVGMLHLLVLVQLAAAVPRAVALVAAAVDGIAMAAMMAGTTAFDLGLLQGSLVLVALVTGLGITAGGWRATSGRLAEQRGRIAREQDRRAVVEERNRIARELHDVIAHHLSLIAVRAETAPFRIPGLEGEGRTELAAVAADARSALVDMRRLLGVLRTDDGVPERAPQPQLADLPDLVEAASASGVPVQLRVHGAPGAFPAPPAAVGLAAYRVAQEALSNATRHAPGAAVQVDLHHLPSGVSVRVENAPPERLTGGPSDDGFDGSGHGLTGMRERVGMLGGSLTAGATSAGGFRVDALLPRDPHHGDAEGVEETVEEIRDVAT